MELNAETPKLTPRTVLGRRLTRLRNEANLSLRQLAEPLGYPHSYLGRVERGDQLPSEALAQALDIFFKTSGLFVELLEMAQDALIADYSRTVVAKEKEAIRIRVFTSSIIPGLFQTEAYARELFYAGRVHETEEMLAEWTVARTKRRRILDAAEPPLYWAILDEAALKRPATSKGCMSNQLRHLVRMAARSHITVQVLPFGQGLHSMLGGSLTLLTLKNGTDVALVESFRTGKPVESAKGVAELVQLFEMACSKALPVPESLDIINGYLKEYGDGNQ